MGENPGPKTIPKLGHLRMGSAVVKAGTGLWEIPQSRDSDVFQQTPKSEAKVVPRPEPRVYDTPKSESVIPRDCRISVLKYVHNSTEDQENVLRDHVNSWN